VQLFPTDYPLIEERIAQIQAERYAKSRNFLNGSVTRLSPYLTHGVFTTQDILERILDLHSFKKAEKLIFELAWRDFFQSVYRFHNDNIFQDLKRTQSPILSFDLPKAVQNAKTQINVLDQSIDELYKTGYMHNHARMWLASVICNIANVHWKTPSQWLYYHLLDGDLASNTLSWQWVAGSFSSKKYYANQTNLNKYSSDKQADSFLDVSYDQLPYISLPEHLKEATKLNLKTALPQTIIPKPSAQTNVLLYHPWMLNPQWHKTDKATRILLLEPSHFENYPMSSKRIAFIRDLSKNIPNLTLVVAEFSDLFSPDSPVQIKTIDHPSVSHWKAKRLTKETPQSMFNPIKKDYRSFFAYWKQCQKSQKFKQL